MLKKTIWRKKYRVILKATKNDEIYIQLDHKTRQSHADMHGVIKPINDKFWDINYPPNGFNCRCCVMFLTSDSLKARGWKSYNGTFPNIADKGFRKHGGKPYNVTYKRLGNETNKRIKENDKFIRKELAIKDDTPKIYDIISSKNKEKDLEAITDFKTAITELLINKNKKANIPPIKIGMLNNETVKIAGQELGINIVSKDIYITKDKISHIRAERKSEYNQAFRFDELNLIPDVLSDKKALKTLDLKKKNLIFWFKDNADNEKMNKIILEFNYKIKKINNKTNIIITVGKVKKSDMNAKWYKKI